MFAPDGYCLIEALEDRVRDVIREIEEGPDFSIIDVDDPSYEIKRLNLLAQFESFLIFEVRKHVLNALSSLQSLAICSPNGLVLKISKDIISPHSEFAESKLLALTKDDNLRLVLLDVRWLIKDGRHFRNLKPSNMTRTMAQNRAFSEEDKLNGRLHKFSEPFRPFIGWSLVFKERDLPKLSELQHLIGSERLGGTGGRPEKKSKALRAFDQIFPNGRQGTPWKVVAEVVGKAIEDDVSAITIQRAINERSKVDQNSD